TDIAVVKINASSLSPATLGDSDEVVVGEEVMAIGNPAGLFGSVTNGIVSAVNRKIKGKTTAYEMDCIQTNADISPGNSG
ncbi:MAG TPA: serine protease HtrA, partial [Ruminococcus sp.]|nr:serine protease HtrA [Ruminococcus sp.]